MVGVIVMWSGAIVDIPVGWQLCDGTNGTPDLLDRFIVCAGNLYDPDDTGGSDTHTHDFTSDGHTHGKQTIFVKLWEEGSGHGFDVQVDTGTTDPEDTKPLYYALAFIMCMVPG